MSQPNVSTDVLIDPTGEAVHPQQERTLINAASQLNYNTLQSVHNQCVHQLFEKQVERTSDLPALRFGSEQLTYRELNERANQLAHHLISLGVGPEVPVGLLLPRSIDLAVSLLAILKAGGAYVPLDLSYPRERLSFMLSDARTRVLITREHLFSELLPASELTPLFLDTEAKEVARRSIEDPAVPVSPENLAYVIYTSGSTGRPKGVAIEHRNTAVLLDWAQETFTPNELGRVIWSTSVCFDLSVFEFFAPLSCGGTSILIEDALQVATLPAEAEPTLLNTVPSAMGELLRVGELPGTLRVIALAGEVLKSNLVERLHHAAPHARLFNLYGPSEDTTYSTAFEVPHGSISAPSIGQPLRNKECYLFNHKLELVPVGEEGELYISGRGLARGYLYRPELTAERFISHPYSSIPGQRLYRTGDLARYLVDGNIEFLGRLDHQIKLRGYRIETGEIESRLEQHPAVAESVVMAHEDESGEKRLCAYLVCKKTPGPSTTELRTFLREQLPDYMLPHAFVELSEFPRTPNGKIDRKALPVPSSSRPNLEEIFVAPVTTVQKKLAGIWGEVLKLKMVGANDDFFAVGGDSLLATRIVTRIRQEFGTDMSIRRLFEASTIAALAERIESDTGESVRSPALSLPAATDGKEPVLSFTQERLWVLDQLQPESGAYNIPLVINLKGRLDTSAMERSFAEIWRRHEVLRTTFQAVDGKPAVSFSSSQLETSLLTDLSGFTENERVAAVKQYAWEESQRGFDLARGPLLRTKLFQLNAAEHFLLVSMHHIVADGWSIDILIDELKALYAAYVSGEASPLPELKFQYADFARFQRSRLQGEMLERQLAYWRGRLSSSLPPLDFPTDRVRSPVQTFRSGTYSLSLPQTLTEAVKRLGQQESATTFMVLLANFTAVLYRYTGQQEITVGSPVAGRNWIEAEKLVGPFLNTLVLYFQLSGNLTFLDLLQQVRTVSLEAYEHQEVPFELLLEQAPMPRDLSRTPLFQVMFNMLNYEGQRTGIKLPDLTMDVVEILEHGSKYDMTLYVREERDTILLNLVYNADLYDETRMTSLLSHFQSLLESAVSEPQHVISRLGLFGDATSMQVFNQQNAVRPELPFVEFKDDEIQQSIASRFEQQVSLYSQHLAVKTQTEECTYEQLNRKANRIAQALLALQGTAYQQVGLVLRHDAPMIAALLGALKAGKTYVPLDITHPSERLSYILEHAQIGAILTENRTRALAGRLAQQRLPVINVDELDQELPETNPALNVAPESLAYILYTSGSTGQPKGVMQSHRNVLHHVRCYTNGLHLNLHDRLTLLSSYAFDAAVMDIFGALLNGAALYPVDLNDAGFDGLEACVVDEEITIYHSTPTVYRYFVGGLADDEVFSSVRLVVLGGEETVRMDVDLYKRHFSEECILVNGFGPTESTLALQYFISKDTDVTRTSVPVGYAVPKTEIHLLDEFGEQVMVHGVGEIAISSEHLALGYWRDTASTAKAFRPDPVNPGKRIYLTGDLGQLLPDGSTEFKGRKDLQAKIRGYRIELGEIEALLRRHPAICECVVILREDLPVDKRLVAYVIPDEQIAPTPSDLRAFLSRYLPEYMVPSIFVTLEELSLTANGKVDRRALPVPDVSHRRLETGLVAPRTPCEQALASIWIEVLRLEEVGIHDNFFELGGNSLLMTQLVSRLRDSLSLELPLRDLFGRPTIAQQADLFNDHFEKQQKSLVKEGDLK